MKEAFGAFLWPTMTEDYPSGIVRLGRLVHWTGTALAVLTFLLFRFQQNGSGDAFNQALLGMLVGFVVYMIARGARYLLAGE